MARKTISSIVLAAVTLLLAGGCGGSGGGHHTTGNDLTGAYIGSAPLQDNFEGDLEFTVSDGGAAVGSLTVSAIQVGAVPFADPGGFPAGTYTVFGSVGSDGTIDLSGTAANVPFTITGQIVGNGSGNSAFLIAIGALQFNGTVTKNENPSTASADVTFSNASTSNAHTEHFPTGEVTGFVNTDENEAFVEVKDSTGRAVTVTVPNSLQVGDSYTFDNVHRLSTYFEPNPINQLFSNTWAADSGSFTLVAKSGTHYSVTLNNVHYTAVTVFGNGVGELTLNGSFQN